MVESQPSKLLVAGSSPVSRSGEEKIFVVYILKSKSVERYYIGSSGDRDGRVETHNSPKARWTKRYQPWEVVHVEEFKTRGEAMKRELELKRLKSIARYLESLKREKAESPQE